VTQLADNQSSEAKPLSVLNIDPNALIAESLAPVAHELSELNDHIRALTGAQTHTAQEVIGHVLGGGGKKIRPALFLMTSQLVKYAGEHRLPMACVCEFVHTASLLHDDIIDNSSVRRNKPTANSIWGDESSVLTGDLIYARASELMAETGSLEIVSIFARAIRLMSEGELLQLEHLYNPDMPIEDYFRIIENKTAVLLAAACSAPAILAHRPQVEIDALALFGKYVGYAFQLLDDALDYAGTEQVFGKKTLADLPEGKVTLPVLALKALLDPFEWASIAKIIRKVEISPKDMAHILAIINAHDTAGQTLAEAERYTHLALEALAIFSDSQEKANLVTLTRNLLLRMS